MEVDLPQVDTGSTSHKVLQTTELLENILLYLPLQDLLLVQRVSRSIRQIVQNSSPIRQALFFESLPPKRKITQNAFETPAESLEHPSTSTQQVQLNPLLKRFLNAYAVPTATGPNSTVEDAFIFVFYGHNLFMTRKKFPSTTSWKKMLPVQPYVMPSFLIDKYSCGGPIREELCDAEHYKTGCMNEVITQEKKMVGLKRHVKYWDGQVAVVYPKGVQTRIDESEQQEDAEVEVCGWDILALRD